MQQLNVLKRLISAYLLAKYTAQEPQQNNRIQFVRQEISTSVPHSVFLFFF